MPKSVTRPQEFEPKDCVRAFLMFALGCHWRKRQTRELISENANGNTHTHTHTHTQTHRYTDVDIPCQQYQRSRCPCMPPSKHVTQIHIRRQTHKTTHTQTDRSAAANMTKLEKRWRDYPLFAISPPMRHCTNTHYTIHIIRKTYDVVLVLVRG